MGKAFVGPEPSDDPLRDDFESRVGRVYGSVTHLTGEADLRARLADVVFSFERRRLGLARLHMNDPQGLAQSWYGPLTEFSDALTRALVQEPTSPRHRGE